MIIHHSLNNNLWDPKRRLLNLSNETAARSFTEILLRGITTSTTTERQQQRAKKNESNGSNAQG
jgi:hypothetical protein